MQICTNSEAGGLKPKSKASRAMDGADRAVRDDSSDFAIGLSHPRGHDIYPEKSGCKPPFSSQRFSASLSSSRMLESSDFTTRGLPATMLPECI